jgi:hypothetical protein
MRVVIRGRELTDWERDSLEFRVRLALSRFGPRLVRVGLDRRPPEEGPRADPSDHRCRIEVNWAGGRGLQVDESDLGWPQAASRALERAVRALERQRELRAVPARVSRTPAAAAETEGA